MRLSLEVFWEKKVKSLSYKEYGKEMVFSVIKKYHDKENKGGFFYFMVAYFIQPKQRKGLS